MCVVHFYLTSIFHGIEEMRTWLLISLLLVLKVTSQNERLHCDWATQFLCGDQCVAIKGGKCFCGRNELSITEAFESFCCNEQSCRGDNSSVFCPDGRVQSTYSHCHQTCRQTAVYGMDTFSCHNQRCYLGTFACRGRQNCPDYSDLTQCTRPIDCEAQTDGVFQPCGQVPGATYQNHACKHRASSTFAYFECLNRLDKIDTLFERPIIIAKKKRESVNYNTILQYDGDFVHCGSRNISFDRLPYVIGKNPREPCQLKNGQSVTLEDLYDLLTQFSFEKSTELMKYHSEESKRKLNLQCFESDQHPFRCNPQSTDGSHLFCAYGHQVCDTIANCPDGSDEDFEMCQDYFSETATIVCQKKDTFHVNVTIKAVACDGITECADGIDERGCSAVLSDEHIYLTFGLVFFIIVVITLILWFDTKGSLKLKQPGEMMTEREFHDWHGSFRIQEKVSRWQGLSTQKAFNQAFYRLELMQHQFAVNATVCCLKNCLDMKTLCNVLKDRPSKKKKKSCLKKFIQFVKKYSGFDL